MQTRSRGKVNNVTCYRPGKALRPLAISLVTCLTEVLGEGHPPGPVSDEDTATTTSQRLVYRVANMRNRASTSLSKGVSPIASLALTSATHKLISVLPRKSVNHGANITCITCNDSVPQLPRTEPSSSKNGPPRPHRVLTTVSRSARASGSACSRSASAASFP
jgi:hypothetical protein